MDFNKKLTQIKNDLLSRWRSKRPTEDVEAWLDNTTKSLSPWWINDIPDMNTIHHGVPHPKNKTLKWFGQDTEDSWKSPSLDASCSILQLYKTFPNVWKHLKKFSNVCANVLNVFENF